MREVFPAIALKESHYGSKNQQRITNNRTTAIERTAAIVTGGLNAFSGTKSSP